MLQAGAGSLQGGTGDGSGASGKMDHGVRLSTAIWDGDWGLNSYHLNPFLPSAIWGIPL